MVGAGQGQAVVGAGQDLAVVGAGQSQAVVGAGQGQAPLARVRPQESAGVMTVSGQAKETQAMAHHGALQAAADVLTRRTGSRAHAIRRQYS